MTIINSIDSALEILQNGGIIAYPTETFYGIGCSIFNINAIEKIYEIKGRDKNQALPLIVKDYRQTIEITNLDMDIESSLQDLVSLFWPTSLSFLLKAKNNIHPLITAGTGKVVVRQSPHTTCQALVNGLNSPLISTSANRSGEKPAECIEEIPEDFGVDAILQVGKNPKGCLPSTIIELLPKREIRLVRQGAFDTSILLGLGYTFV